MTTAVAASVRSSFRNVEIVGGGFITGIVAHPRERGLFYARTDVGGAYRRDARAERWLPITDWIGQRDFRYTGVESIALDPSDPERVYLALGIYNDQRFRPSAIARSSDRGRSFALTPMPFGMGGNEAGRGSGERLAVDPRRSQVVLFGSRDAGLWKSDDFGQSFRPLEAFPRIETRLPNPTPERWNYLTQAVGIVFVLFDPRRDRTLYVGVSTAETSLFRSTDGGESWAPLVGQPLGLRPIRAALAANGVLYVTYGREPGPNTMSDGAVHRFDTERERWANVTPVAPDPGGGQPFGYAGVAVGATNPDEVVVTTACRDHAPGSGGDELFRSLDGGHSWRAIGQSGVRDASRAPWLDFGRGVHVGHWMYALALDPFDPDQLYYGTGQTIWAATNLTAVDRGELARFVVHALGIEETVPLALTSPERGPELIAGVGDISGFTVFDPDHVRANVVLRGPTFKDTTGLDHAALRPELVVRVGSRGWNRAEDRDTGAISSDGGRSWRGFASYPAPGASSGHVAVGADGAAFVWWPREGPPHYTRDLSRSFCACRGVPDGGGRLVADRVDPRAFYLFAESGAVFASVDGGESFEPTGAVLAPPFADACAVFGRRGQLWVAAGGALVRSRDGARSFDVFAGWSSVSHVSVGKAAPGSDAPTLFVAGEREGVEGLFRSSDEARSFARIDDEQHRFGQIRALCADPKRFGRVYIATGGRGVIFADGSEV